MINPLPRAAGAALLVLFASACSAVSAGQSPLVPLDGTAWVLATLPGRDLLAGTAATLQFAASRVSGSDGCNRFSGGFTQAQGALQVAQLASTQMACPPEVMEQARAVTAAVSGARSYRIAGDTLDLLDAGGTSRATFKAQSTALAGTRWHASGINNGKGAVASLVADSAVTLDFGADGRASGSAGCNRYTAGYDVARDALKFGAAAATRMLCADPAVMAQEQAYLAALAQVATARIEGDRLELRGADGALAAVFHRVDTD